MTLRHHSQPPMRKLLAASRRSPGKAAAPAITLNRMYHCVPSTISGVSQISAFRLKYTMNSTTGGNSRLAGNAARNCASGCARRAQTGRSPSQTPIGTQSRLASTIRIATRASVNSPSTNAWRTSPQLSSPRHEADDLADRPDQHHGQHREPDRIDHARGPRPGLGAALAAGSRAAARRATSPRRRPRRPPCSAAWCAGSAAAPTDRPRLRPPSSRSGISADQATSGRNSSWS